MRNKIYLDPIGGIAGDMFSAAFVDAGLIKLETLQSAIAAFDNSITLVHEKALQCQINGSRLRVITKQGEESYSHAAHAPHSDHEHYPFHLIKERLAASPLEESVQHLSLKIFTTLAKAEAKMHNQALDEVAFHEVGRDDAIADIIAAATCICTLDKDTDIYCGALPLGQGEVHFSHGSFTLPAPATAEILMNVPITPGKGQYEMTTPTGAAIISSVCHHFVTQMPTMQIRAIGYGHGNIQPKHFPNTLRLFYGYDSTSHDNPLFDFDEVIALTCNIDDQPANLLANCIDRFLQAGAIDVFYNTYQGKKGRTGQQWTVLTTPVQEQSMALKMFEELGTIGIRTQRHFRYKLFREEKIYAIGDDNFRAKKVTLGENNRIYPETEDIIRLSAKWQLSLLKTWEKLNFIILSDNENQ